MTYLDTHVAVWLFAGSLGELSPAALAEVETGELFISPMVLLEIQYLKEIGRIGAGPEEILAGLRQDIALKVCPIPFRQVIAASYMEDWTRDAFDRIIVAHARTAASPLISKDRTIRQSYARCLW